MNIGWIIEGRQTLLTTALSGRTMRSAGRRRGCMSRSRSTFAIAVLPVLALLSGCQGGGALTDCSDAIPWDEVWKYPGEEQVVRGEVHTTLAGWPGEYGMADSLFIGVPGPSNIEEAFPTAPVQSPGAVKVLPTRSVELNEDGSARALVVHLPSEFEESAYWGRAICARGVIRPGSAANPGRWTDWPRLSVRSTEDILIDE